MALLKTLADQVPYWNMLFELLPRGPIWARSDDRDSINHFSSFSALEAFLYAVAEELRLVHNRLVDLLAESDPRTADELLPEWLTTWGLPDPGLTMPATDDGKRALLAGKVAAQGGQSRDYFIRVARTVLGDTQDDVTIVERPWGSVFRAWTGHAWDRVNGIETAHHWWVYLPATATEAQADAIEALFEAFKPAHTVVTVVRPVVAVYESPGGGGDYASAGSSVAARTMLPGTTPETTIVFWAQATGDGYLFEASDDGTPSLRGRVVDSATGWRTQAYDDTGGNAELDIYPASLATWGHLAFVFDGAELKLYVDGTYNEGSSAGATWATATSALTLFADRSQANNVAGALANVAIFARALTADEVAALAAAGRKHDLRKPLGAGTTWAGETPAVYWRDTDTAGAVASVGDGGDCDLELQGSVASTDDWT